MSAVSKIYTAKERERMPSVVPDQNDELERLEGVIAGGLRTFVDVGNALKEIRDKQLYRERGFGTFESYCKQHWDFTKGRVSQLVSAAGFAAQVYNCKPPDNEAQVRPLLGLPESERVKVWEEAVVTAPGGRVTAKHVAGVVASRACDTTTPVFHILVASGDLVDAIMRLILKWPERERVAIPRILRDIADDIEGGV